jgi:hypothetical protein
MAFTLDRTVSFVKIAEPDLISIHRSTHSIIPKDDSFQGHLCEAFICTARENDSCRVFVALYDTRQKSNLIFVDDPVALKESDSLIRQAEAFLHELGFSMAPVNISFSVATREVVIRDLKVMRPPKHVAARQQAAPEAQARDTKELPHREVVPAVVPAQRQSDSDDAGGEKLLASRLAETVTALERITAEKDEFERKAERELKKLKAERGMLSKELEAARLEVERVATVKKDGDDGKFAALVAERDTLKCDLSALRQDMEKLRGELDAVQSELGGENSRLRQEIERLEGEQDYALIGLTYEAESLRESLSAANEALMAARAWNDKQESSAAALSNEVEALRAALATADKTLGSERVKNESALREMDALEQNAADEMKILEKRIESLSEEKRGLEVMAAELKSNAGKEIERLRQVNQSQRRSAIKKVNALKEEIRQLAEARAAMTSSFGVALLPGVAEEPPPAAKHKEAPAKGDPASESSTDNATNPFELPGSFDEISFEPDTALKGVPYGEPEDVIEVHRSFNKIQAAHFGKVAQSCDGFVCKVKNDSRTEVYAVWFMNVTGEVIVCRPDPQPENAGSVRRALREGVDYFERVGFLMDQMHLEEDRDLRLRQLDTLGIFHRIDMERAA